MYKRQIKENIEQNKIEDMMSLSATLSEICKNSVAPVVLIIDEVDQASNYKAVSYTHLDVYKRQVQKYGFVLCQNTYNVNSAVCAVTKWEINNAVFSAI